MSMLSAQCDELRELAGDGSVEFVSGPIRASVLRDAADTILELRDDLQRANAENERLRSDLESVGTASYLYGRSDLKAENAKLRELVRHMHTCMEHYEPDGSVSCDRCPLDNDTGDCDYEQRMSELGIEVDG